MKAALPPIVNSQSTMLILGSMPGEKSLQAQQYYANRGNHFWKLMFSVFNLPFSYDYADRLYLLESNKIALWDVLAYCEREGSLDSNIKNEQPNDFNHFFKSFPNIINVFFSSKAAEKYYEKYCIKQPNILYHVLPSPSGANAGKTFLQKLESWQVLSTSR